jgi:chemotaxis protein CheY-P-specific phosphatase CheC
MNDPKLKECLTTVLCRVLEQAAFVFPEPTGEVQQIDPQAVPFIQVSLSFSGAKSGQVSLIMPKALCGEFSANMLGENPEEGESSDSQIDAAKEIGNIVTGQLLTEFYGAQAMFNQTAPEVVELSPEAFFATLDGREYVCSMVDEHPVIALFTETGTAYEHQSSHR